MGLRLVGITLLLVLAVVLSGAAPDIGGMWDGSMELKSTGGDSVKWEVYAEFQQSGKTVTGTAGPNVLQQFDIQRGVFDGTTLTFQITVPGDPAPVYRMKLKLTKPDLLDGTVDVQVDGVLAGAGKITLARNK